MIVDITGDSVTLVDPDDCGRFHATIAARLSDGTADTLLASNGAGHRVDADHLAIDVAWLRAAAREVEKDWTTRFNKMLAFAGTKGWITDDGLSVVAHIARD